jgi:alpha-beta hydrolase superfamily lysophospholipase
VHAPASTHAYPAPTPPHHHPARLPLPPSPALPATQEDAFRRASEFHLPLWIGFGTEDKVNHAPGAQDYLSKVATPEQAKEFRWYEGLFHTLAFEEEREQVFADVLAFLDKHK